MNLEERGSIFKKLIAKNSLEYFLSKNQDLIFHLTGVKNLPGYVFYNKGELSILTDKRFSQEIELAPENLSKIIYTNSITAHLGLQKLQSGKTGIEFSNLSYSEYISFVQIFGSNNVIDVSDPVSEYLSINDDDQIEAFIKGVELTKELFTYCEKIFHENVSISEKELVAELFRLVAKSEADSFSFDPIVAVNENTSKPHHVPSRSNLRDCSILLVDLGVKYDGVCTDVTRTFLKGKDKKQKQIEKIVKRGFNDVLKLVKAGVKVSEIAAAWGKLTDSNGLTEHFTHALGHGLGYSVHQKPRISEFSNEIIIENQIITLEPALYFPREFGYRYECDILVTETGFINLTAF